MDGIREPVRSKLAAAHEEHPPYDTARKYLLQDLRPLVVLEGGCPRDDSFSSITLRGPSKGETPGALGCEAKTVAAVIASADETETTSLRVIHRSPQESSLTDENGAPERGKRMETGYAAIPIWAIILWVCLAIMNRWPPDAWRNLFK